MHFVEPFYNWRGYYIADEDPSSPFYGRELYADYDERYAIIELIGEWNDAIENDIMLLKRDVIDVLIESGINAFILIGENVLNFHHSDDCYYEEWFDDVEDGWIAMVNFHDHVIREFEHVGIDHYFVMGGELEEIEWRTYQPQHFYQKVAALVQKRIG
ncbi:MAG: hypothetical protein LW804_07305 [Cryomorphaceae bacterium]|nr:hypothetical protein [Cryomorphaceae bacterium]